MNTPVEGFSKLSKEEKIDWIARYYTQNPESTKKILAQYWNTEPKLQKLHDEFIENTITNYYLPLGIAPNFCINGKLYAIPMAIEESSVVAAASKAAKYWRNKGGFTATVLGTEKIGQIHFMYRGNPERLKTYVAAVRPKLLEKAKPITQKMEQRGGGISEIVLKDKTTDLDHYYQLHCTFETLDAMGANFINSCLEQLARTFTEEALQSDLLDKEERHLEIVMSILSNYVPNCLVRAVAECPLNQLHSGTALSPRAFAKKIVQAVRIAEVEPYRAVTHNKGIMNGIDAVVLATGNDFRAVEAGIHAYATKDGNYTSLSRAEITDDTFRFWIEVPLALGTVGGLTGLHPLVKLALEILGNPSSRELMQIVAVAGLAQNFAALQSLVTTGIQQGHMKMHLLNILNQMNASDGEKKRLISYFTDKTVTHAAVKDALDNIRNGDV
ncbi:MAG: hydroxymethylglutaryl-CoA reductase, degradative [Bacteroidota bacterium]